MVKSPKRQAQISHKIAVCTYILSEALQEGSEVFGTESPLKLKCDDLNKECERILSDVFQLKGISGSVYLTDAANKFDTLIIKNYVQIQE